MTSKAISPGAPEGGPPQELGHYVIEGELGRGGMGVVYLARDRKLDRQVAIKTLPAALAREPEQLARFEREAKLLASLNHPNIATIHGLEEAADATRYLILERVEGETLADRLRRGPLPIGDATQVCDQVADALEAAHERGVIHRDLKPRNIMITPGGRVKVLDFGLAKRTGAERPSAGPDASLMTEAGIMMGTPGYMAPEQILAQPQDARADIFAFGCVLFEALSGTKAFDSDVLPVLVALVLSGEPDWTKLPGELPAGFRHLIGRCLEKDPERRPPGMHEVRRGLRALLQEHVSGHTSTLASLSGTLHNLPREVASFVGRERELEECGRLLQQTRILTLTGSGGSGKTRLAVRLATGLVQKHAGGVWFVDLGPLSDPGRVMQAMAQSLNVREESGRSLERSLIERLQGHQALLLLDNCEHVLGACGPLVETLLQACENLKVLATSREPLGLTGEQVYSVPTLAVPAAGARLDPGALASYAGVQLFVDRAAQVQPTFALDAKNAEAVADICRRLDGIPFAIELAAARVKVLAVDQIRAKLDDRFRLLTGGSKASLPRHQTLRATIQWSYDHLHTEEQQLNRALAVFAGGWTLEGATRVCGVSEDEFEVLDLLTRLVDKSLVVVEHARGGESRYRFLETVRQYALERLVEAQESEAVRNRHVTFFCELAEQAEPGLRGAEQAEWVRRLGAEHENLLAAIAWHEPPAGQPEMALRVAGAVWRFWLIRGHLELGRRMLEQTLAAAGGTWPAARGKALYGASLLAFAQGDYPAAERGVEECLALYREAGDSEREAACLGMLGNIAAERQDFDAARQRYEQALVIYRADRSPRGIATIANNLGTALWRLRDLAGARANFEEAARTMLELGDRDSRSIALLNLAGITTAQGDLAAAASLLVEGLEILHDLGSKRPLPMALEVAAGLAESRGELARAVSLRGTVDALRHKLRIADEGGPQVQQEALARLRPQVGDGFDTAWQAGQRLEPDEALGDALAWLGSPLAERESSAAS